MKEMDGHSAERAIRKHDAPDRLAVANGLTIRASDVEYMPSWITAFASIRIEDCPQLTRGPERVSTRADLYILRCPKLRALPAEIVMGAGMVMLDRVRINLSRAYVEIEATIPDTAMLALVGRPLRDLIAHDLLTGRAILDATITGIRMAQTAPIPLLHVDLAGDLTGALDLH